MAMHRVLSCDLLICDVLVPLQQQPALAVLMERYNREHPDHAMRPGSKSPLSYEQFESFREAAGDGCEHYAGGSAANTLTTLKKLCAGELAVTFIGATGDDYYGRIIHASLDGSDFTLVPHARPVAGAHSAVSLVMTYRSGERAIATYPGTAHLDIAPEIITDALMESVDIVFLQGSLWQKFGEAFASSLYERALAHGKELWLALPTHSRLGQARADLFAQIIPQAAVLLGNAEELMRISRVTTLLEALSPLKEMYKKAAKDQVAFITCGRDGAAVVTQDGIEMVPPVPTPQEEIKNTLGAGDAAFAGFLFGTLKCLPPAASAAIAMELAAENIRHAHARIPNPTIATQV